MFEKLPGEDFINSWYPIIIALVAGVFFGLRNYFKGNSCDSTEMMNKKTVIVTGANTGMGKEIARDMAKRGAHVIMACRDLSKGAEAKKDLVELFKVKEERLKVMQLDLASFDSVRDFVSQFLKDHNSLHVLFNNAGVMCHPRAETQDGNEIHFQTNYLGHFLLTELLLDTLKASAPARIVNTSALAYQLAQLDLDDLAFKSREYSPGELYSLSKLAVMMWTHQLSTMLTDSKVCVSVVQPGVVNTDAHRHMPFKQSAFIRYTFAPLCWFLMKTAKDGAQTSIYCGVAKEEDGVSGKYYAECKQAEATVGATDDETCQQLYDLTRDLIYNKPAVSDKKQEAIVHDDQKDADTDGDHQEAASVSAAGDGNEAPEKPADSDARDS